MFIYLFIYLFIHLFIYPLQRHPQYLVVFLCPGCESQQFHWQIPLHWTSVRHVNEHIVNIIALTHIL